MAEPVDKWETKHVIRASRDLWDDFGKACKAKNTDRSAVIRAYMRRYVAAWRGQQADPQPGEGPASPTAPQH